MNSSINALSQTNPVFGLMEKAIRKQGACGLMGRISAVVLGVIFGLLFAYAAVALATEGSMLMAGGFGAAGIGCMLGLLLAAGLAIKSVRDRNTNLKRLDKAPREYTEEDRKALTKLHRHVSAIYDPPALAVKEQIIAFTKHSFSASSE